MTRFLSLHRNFRCIGSKLVSQHKESTVDEPACEIVLTASERDGKRSSSGISGELRVPIGRYVCKPRPKEIRARVCQLRRGKCLKTGAPSVAGRRAKPVASAASNFRSAKRCRVPFRQVHALSQTDFAALGLPSRCTGLILLGNPQCRSRAIPHHRVQNCQG